jgi:hypothetical protein
MMCRKGFDDMKIALKLFVRKLQDNRSLRNTNYRWESSIKKDLGETGCENMEWIKLA